MSPMLRRNQFFYLGGIDSSVVGREGEKIIPERGKPFQQERLLTSECGGGERVSRWGELTVMPAFCGKWK